MRLDAQVPVRAELAGIGGGQAVAADGAQEQVELLAGDVGAAGVGGAVLAEGLPAAQGGLG